MIAVVDTGARIGFAVVGVVLVFALVAVWVGRRLERVTLPEGEQQ